MVFLKVPCANAIDLGSLLITIVTICLLFCLHSKMCGLFWDRFYFNFCFSYWFVVFFHWKVNSLRKSSFLVSFIFSQHEVQCHSDNRSSVHVRWVIWKWDSLLNWRSYWTHRHFQEPHFQCSFLCSFSLHAEESLVMNCSVKQESQANVIGSDQNWEAFRQWLEPRAGSTDVLNTHANCGLHINRYEKVKVSFTV